MTYTYYSKRRPLGPGCCPFRADNMPEDLVSWDRPHTEARCGAPAWGKVTYPRPLSNEDLMAFELVSGAVPTTRDIAEALDCGMVYPAFRDGLLCICINADPARGVESDELSLPGNGTVSGFWRGGLGRASRAVQDVLRDYLADDELATHVVRFIRALGGRDEPDAQAVRRARMIQAVESPELAALCGEPALAGTC